MLFSTGLIKSKGMYLSILHDRILPIKRNMETHSALGMFDEFSMMLGTFSMLCRGLQNKSQKLCEQYGMDMEKLELV